MLDPTDQAKRNVICLLYVILLQLALRLSSVLHTQVISNFSFHIFCCLCWSVAVLHFGCSSQLWPAGVTIICVFLTLSHLLQKLVAQMKQDPQVNLADVCVNEIIDVLMIIPSHAHIHLVTSTDALIFSLFKVLHESVLVPTNTLPFSERRSEEAAPRTSSKDHSAQWKTGMLLLTNTHTHTHTHTH